MVNSDSDPKDKPASQVRFTLLGRILKKRYGRLPTITPRREPEKKRVLVQTSMLIAFLPYKRHTEIY
jgi:hypothetical protein